MTDDNVTSIRLAARRDVTEAQIADTADRIGQFYKQLIGYGISNEAATEMTKEFSSMLLSHHFGNEYKPQAAASLFGFLEE